MGGLGNQVKTTGGYKSGDDGEQSLTPSQTPVTPTNPSAGSTNGMNPESTGMMPEMNPNSSSNSESMPEKPAIDQPMTNASTPETPMPETVPDEPMKPSPEELQAADQAIAGVRQAVLKFQWDKLGTLAEAAASAAKTPEQTELAEGLVQLVDLATYYRDGIFRTLLGLKSGQEIDLKEGIKFVIVERNAQQLVIRVNGANKSYRLDALPLPLVSRFGEMAMPDESPTSRAAKYVYQSLAESTNAAFRQKAVQELSQIDEEIEGAEVEKLVNAIRFLYPQ